MKKATIRDRILGGISNSRDVAFLRSEFSSFGCASAVGRALKSLVNEKRLIRVGHGMYAKVKGLTANGYPIPAAELLDVGLQLMKKLGVDADMSWWQKEYRAGRTTQIPVNAVLVIRGSKVNRRIAFGERRYVRYQYEKK